MRTILTISLLMTTTLAAFAAVPVASAECVDATTCVNHGGSKTGSCDTTGQESNFVSAYTTQQGTTVYVSASTLCRETTSILKDSWFVNVAVFGGPAPYTQIYGGWSETTASCRTYVTGNGIAGPIGTQDLGCPAGGPPHVPAVMP